MADVTSCFEAKFRVSRAMDVEKELRNSNKKKEWVEFTRFEFRVKNNLNK